MARTALVTGGNRGIGFEVCRQLGAKGYQVILGARDAKLGVEAATELQSLGHEVIPVSLDVSSDDDVVSCAESLERDGICVDILINNAGIMSASDLLSAPEAMAAAIDVNLMGPYRTARAFAPGMNARAWGRIVNVSSNSGSFGEGLEGPAAYAISKAALNALTVRLAREVHPNVLVNSSHPGWVPTRMGGTKANSTIEHGADTIVWLSSLKHGGPTGGFFSDRKPLPW